MGRPKGSLNRNKRSLLARLKEEYGEEFHPILRIAQNCVDLQKSAKREKDPEKRDIKLKAANAEWARMAEYVEPKLKSIEHDVSGNVSHAVISDKPMSEEEWEEKYCK